MKVQRYCLDTILCGSPTAGCPLAGGFAVLELARVDGDVHDEYDGRGGDAEDERGRLIAPTSRIFSACMYAGSSAPPNLGAEVETPRRAATRAGACAAARRARFRRALDIGRATVPC